METSTRRYDLDWLRVVAIIAVYFHHLGMPFNGDDFHIMNLESSKLLDDIMVYFEQFRLPLLFLISRTGTALAFSKRTWKQFLMERTRRLTIPLVFGVLFIVPPQTYYQYINKFDSYWQVYIETRFEINHLWFIETLYIISIIAIPLIILLKSTKSKHFRNRLGLVSSNKIGFLVGGMPLIIVTIILKRYYSTDASSLTNLSETLYYAYFFIAGVLLAKSQTYWDNLKKFRRLHLIAFLLSTLLFYGYYFVPSIMLEPYLSLSVRWDIWYGLCCLLSWSFLLTLLGYSQIYLDRPSKWLKRIHEAIYPFYILHQTVIVVFAYYIVQLELTILSKVTLLFISSILVIVVVYSFLIYPFKITRLLFGMKNSPKK